MNAKGRSTLKKLESELKFKNYAENTIKVYLFYAEVFLNEFDCDVYHIGQKKTIEYLKNKKFNSISQQNQYISAVKTLFKYIIGSKLEQFKIERPKKNKTLPKIIDNAHLINSINNIDNLKHRAILSLAYSVGLRVSEVINLKISDIDSKRMLILIKNAKGHKDRLVPLSENILILLRNYYREFKPYKYLFNGQCKMQYTANSCNKLVKKYLGNNYHFHMLRHSSFTAMLENGTDISLIQKIAGHAKTDTTRIYTHVSNQLLSKIALPL